MKVDPSMTKEEILAAIHEEIWRLQELLNHLDAVLPEHEEKLKEHPSD